MTRLAALLLSAAIAGCAEPPGETDPPAPFVPGDLDADGDGILDVHEGEADPDGDGKPAFQDKDSDDDGLPDSLEAGDQDLYTFPVDSDGDRVPDFLDVDSDNNGVPDGREPRGDLDGDGLRDAADPDDDGDGLLDKNERINGAPFDSDGDGDPDERDTDSDGDRIPDGVEAACALMPSPCDTDGDGQPDHLDLDTDGDGFMDADEAGPTPATPRDTDGDGRSDWRDLDADGDGLLDREEVDVYGTDPLKRDSDGDGYSDQAERVIGTDPRDAASTWRGWYVEVPERQEREQAYTFRLGLHRLDVVVMLQHRYVAYSGSINLPIDEAIRSWSAMLPDVAFSLVVTGSYRDWPWGWMDMPRCDFCARADFESTRGFDGIRPVYLDLPLGTPVDEVLDLTEHYLYSRHGTERLSHYRGPGLHPTPWDAVVQVLEGPGLDQDCDGIYDPRYDILPWEAGPDDPFGGLAGQRKDTEALVGIQPGLGFRPFARPILVMVDALPFLDPGFSNPDPDHYTNRVDHFTSRLPPSCPAPATAAQAAALVRARRGAVATLAYTDPGDPSWWIETDPRQPSAMGGDTALQKSSFLADIGVKVDLDLDGVRDDLPLVTQALDEYGGGWSLNNPASLDTITAIVEAFENDLSFDRVRLHIEGDTHGLVAGVEPAEVTGLKKGDEASFTVLFRGTVPAREDDQVFQLRLNVLTDDDDLADSQPILVVVPGRSVR